MGTSRVNCIAYLSYLTGQVYEYLFNAVYFYFKIFFSLDDIIVLEFFLSQFFFWIFWIYEVAETKCWGFALKIKPTWKSDWMRTYVKMVLKSLEKLFWIYKLEMAETIGNEVAQKPKTSLLNVLQISGGNRSIWK